MAFALILNKWMEYTGVDFDDPVENKYYDDRINKDKNALVDLIK